MPRQHRTLMATDGSHSAQAALATTARFPWPPSSRAQAVVTRLRWLPPLTGEAQAVAEASFASLLEAVAEHRADVLMLGKRATGGFEPMLLGSVANGALEHSPVPVMLVR